MKIAKSLIVFIAATLIYHAGFTQTLSPKVLATAGGYFSGGGNTLSWTMGETFHTTLQNGNLVLTQGQQQPYILLKILNFKAYIEGFYTGGGLMQAALYNNDPMLPSNYCDSITVELHDANSPYNLIASKTAIMLTDGSAQVQYPSSLANGSYYVVLRHRNTVETWSKNTVSFNSSLINFDFTTP